MSQNLRLVLKTSLTLIEQFQSSLYSSPSGETSSELPKKDVLPLLSTSATLLRSQVTKLSLLTINSPFTYSAVGTVLTALNESVLPSLVTAALLVTPTDYTKAFHTEIQLLAKTALKELVSLIEEVQAISEKADKAKKGNELSKAEKDVVTVATGRVWDSCDRLIDVAAKGVIGFLIQRVEEWRDLVRDAVEEIEEWDPDEEGDEFFDELLSDDEKNKSDDDDDEDEEGSAALHAQKKSTIRILKPVAQIYPAIITNRLKKATTTPSLLPSGISKLECLMTNMQLIPEHIDEVAGALYEADLEKSTEQLGKVKDYAVKAINSMVLPWNTVEGSDSEQKTADKFTAWSKTWLRVMDEVSKSINDAKSSS